MRPKGVPVSETLPLNWHIFVTLSLQLHVIKVILNACMTCMHSKWLEDASSSFVWQAEFCWVKIVFVNSAVVIVIVNSAVPQNWLCQYRVHERFRTLDLWRIWKNCDCFVQVSAGKCAVWILMPISSSHSYKVLNYKRFDIDTTLTFITLINCKMRKVVETVLKLLRNSFDCVQCRVGEDGERDR